MLVYQNNPNVFPLDEPLEGRLDGRCVGLVVHDKKVLLGIGIVRHMLQISQLSLKILVLVILATYTYACEEQASHRVLCSLVSDLREAPAGDLRRHAWSAQTYFIADDGQKLPVFVVFMRRHPGNHSCMPGCGRCE